MSSIAFLVIAVLTLAGALAAATLPKLIHAALSLVVAFVGVAAFYFLLGAEFVGLVQIFVYVGAVAVLIVFTILLTRHESENGRAVQLGRCRHRDRRFRRPPLGDSAHASNRRGRTTDRSTYREAHR